MRIAPTVVFAASCLLARAGWSDDVSYKLDLNESNNTVTTASLDLPKIAIADRAWAAPGIEEARSELLPPRPFDLGEAKAIERYQIERSVSISGFKVHSQGPREGPQWIDEVAWPRTRELYGLGQTCQYDKRKEFSFGGITLQR